jgi:lysophospholipase L1-like esterase
MTKIKKSSLKEESMFERNPVKTWILLFFFFCLFIVLVVAFLETYCGYKYYKYRDTLRESVRAIRLRENYPNSDYKFTGDKFVKKNVKFRIDSNGYVYPSVIHKNPDIKIFFIGGSITECMMVDEDKRFPYYCGRLLEKISGKEINSYNSGVSGNNSLHSIDILINKILPEKPDYVVFMHNINDVSTLAHTGTYWNNNTYRSPLISFEKNILSYKVCLPKNKFVRNFIPYISLVLLPTTFESDNNDINYYDEWAENTEPLHTDTSEFISEFKNNLTTFILLCKTRNITPVLMTQSSNFAYDPKYFPAFCQFLHVKFNEIIRETANDNEVILIDLAKEFSNKGNYFFDYIHYNDSGSIAVSKYISKSLSPEILKPRSR